MYGYKVYFDGDKFVTESEPSKVEQESYDSTVYWYMSVQSAVLAASLLNSAYRKNREDLRDANDFLIRTCKDCSEYFILLASEVKWFEDKGFKLPGRCYACRLKRKQERERI